jgi:hypothetical protein
VAVVSSWRISRRSNTGAVLVLEVHEVARRYVADHDANVVDIDRRFDELSPSADGRRLAPW